MKVLVVPGVSVPTVAVNEPAKFKVPAPPLISKTLFPATPVTKTRFPEIVNVPDVTTIFAT